MGSTELQHRPTHQSVHYTISSLSSVDQGSGMHSKIVCIGWYCESILAVTSKIDNIYWFGTLIDRGHVLKVFLIIGSVIGVNALIGNVNSMQDFNWQCEWHEEFFNWKYP